MAIETRVGLKTILIVGGGLSGTLVAAQLLRRAASRSPIRLVLAERRPLMGRGVAYGTHSPVHLLNVPAAKMSAFADEPDHFLAWARQHRQPDLQPGDFAPRMWYGEYLESLLRDAEAEASDDVEFQRIQGTVTAIRPITSPKGGALVAFEDGVTLHADFVVLATGNHPPGNPSIPGSADFYQSKRYVSDAWSSVASGERHASDAVLLIGTGLTMVDKVLELIAQGHTGEIHAVSRHGLLPREHRAGLAPLDVCFSEIPTTARTLTRYVRQLINRETESGGDWRRVIDGLRPHTQIIWRQLPLTERGRFLRHVRPYWETHRHRMAAKVATVIQERIGSGQMKIHAGRIEGFEESGERVDVLVRERCGGEPVRLSVHQVINCTGPTTNFHNVTDPLIRQLVTQGLIAPDALGLGLETNEDGALIDAKGVASPYLHTLGSPMKPRLWESTAAPELRKQAEELAEYLLRRAETNAVTLEEQRHQVSTI